MSKPTVLHKQLYRRGPFGGTVNTTLCGRLRLGVENNVALRDNDVTCSFCKNKMKAAQDAQQSEVKK